jgi:SNF2 family DNA or RNA helicase
MAYFKNLITVKILKNKNTIQAQRLASCMAWQILNDYPTRQKPKEWTIYNNLRGVMLADEVGGGKTFETLAIISKALLENTSKTHSKDRFRILIIANPSIRSKWEWSEDDNLTFEKFDHKSYNSKCEIGNFIRQTNVNTSSTKKLFDFFSKQILMRRKKDWLELDKFRQGIWLTSFSGLPVTTGFNTNSSFIKGKKGQKVFPINFFDWIIVDEAHSLKSGSKDIDESIQLEGSSVRKIHAVINASQNAKVLLLTATPFQNSKGELQYLLSLLENNNTKNKSNNITSLISRGINSLENELSKIDKEGISIEKVRNLKQMFDNDINALIGFENSDKIQRPFELQINGAKNGFDDYLRDIMIRNTKESLPIKPIIAKLDERGKFQYLLFRDLIKISEDESQMFSTKLSQLVSSRESFSKSNINSILNLNIENLFQGNLVFEAKYKKLLETIERIKTSKTKNVITVFVSWLETVDILESRFQNKKYKVFKLTGQVPTAERNNKLEDIKIANAYTTQKIILLASRVGNEGLDFDNFCNRVIHYDNNFNPAIIDQRNGRVYRGSNIKNLGKKVTHKDIEIYQLFIEESYDQRILFIEQEKRKMKNFYLGDGSLQKVLEKTIEKNNLNQEDSILRIIDTIKIDLTPNKKFILKKYKNEITE